MPAPLYNAAKFGGRALPGTGALQAWVDMLNGGNWSLDDIQPGDSRPQLGIAGLAWRGRGAFMSQDFQGGREVVLPTLYKETTGSPLSSALATLSQAGEQYLTFDTATYLSVRYAGFASRVMRRKFNPLWWRGTLSFRAADPWAKDFQAAGSLANLLNPAGGFESALVQPTVYGSTVIQSNDFETAPGTVDYGHSIGTEALGTLAGWTTSVGLATPTVAANVVTFPTAQNSGIFTGHPDMQDMTWWVRFNPGSGATIYLYHRVVNSMGSPFTYIRTAFIGGSTFHIAKQINTGGEVSVSGTSTAVTAANTWYWAQLQASGTTYTLTLYADNAGAVGAAVTGGSVTGTATDTQIASGSIGMQGSGGTTAAQVGGAFANVCYVTGPAPTGSTVNLNGGTWAAAKEPWFCWSKKQAYYGTASLSIYYPIASSPASWWNCPTVSLTSGIAYQVSCVAMVLGGTGSAYLAEFTSNAWTGNAVSAATWTPSRAAYTPGATANRTIALQGGNTTAGVTLYFDYATIVQPNTPTGVLGSSLGTAIAGFTPYGNSLAAFTALQGALAIASNQVTGNGRYKTGHADFTDGTVIGRASAPTVGSNGIGARAVDNANLYRLVIQSDGNIVLYKTVASVTTALTSTGAATATLGSAYWLRLDLSGTTLTAYYALDAGGYPAAWTAIGTPQTDASITSGAVTIESGSNGFVGGAYPGTFLVQGPAPTGWAPTWVAGEPWLCWSKVSPHAGTYSGSVFCNDAGSTGKWRYAFNAALASYNYQGYLKATGAGTASLSVNGTGPKSVTQDNAWHQSADANLALAAGATGLDCQLAGAGTAYFDDLMLQQAFDSVTGLYSQAFADQVALSGSPGAGTTTTYAITYAGSVWGEPLYQITLPATKGAAISSVTLVNQTTGVGLTINFATPLAAGTAYVLQIDCANLTVSIGSTQYDWTGPGGAKCGFPFLYSGANTIAITLVTSSGTATGCTADYSVTNRWEL